MGSALYQCIVHIQKLVFLPFQVGSGMRALIVVGEKFTIFMYDKNSLHFTIDFDLKALAARVFYVGSFTKNVCHNVW